MQAKLKGAADGATQRERESSELERKKAVLHGRLEIVASDEGRQLMLHKDVRCSVLSRLGRGGGC